MAKTTKRYHSHKTGRYISKKQWVRERKKGKAKREKIVVGKRKAGTKVSGGEGTPRKPETVIERLKYPRRGIDIEITTIDGFTKKVQITFRGGKQFVYTRPQDITPFRNLIDAARNPSRKRSRKARRK